MNAKQMTRHNGRRYRVVVYPVLNEGAPGWWAGFVESAHYYEGGTGPQLSRRAAMLECARIVARQAVAQ